MTTEPKRYTVQEVTGCWIWNGAPDTYGYGRVSFRLNGKRVHKGAHRLMYEVLVGPVPTGLQLDHLCHNRKCVNPSHLEAVTPAENIRRGNTGENMRSKTHCPHGHPYTPENLTGSPRKRKCKTCDRSRQRNKYKSIAAAAGVKVGA